MELELSILRVARRDHRQGDLLRARLEDRVLPAFCQSTQRLRGVVRNCIVPDPRRERDALIAATALVHGMTVVTRNGGDFHVTGVAVLDPWVG
jgi:predicted nucleic acid-binding protein